MPARVAGGDHAPVGGEAQGRAVPVADAAAGRLDHGHERQVVVGLQRGLDGEVLFDGFGLDRVCTIVLREQTQLGRFDEVGR